MLVKAIPPPTKEENVVKLPPPLTLVPLRLSVDTVVELARLVVVSTSVPALAVADAEAAPLDWLAAPARASDWFPADGLPPPSAGGARLNG
jgi:hypothetical protein